MPISLHPSPLRLRMITALLIAACVGFATPAFAVKVCGDDVQGTRVACACGDVAVSDVTLRASDPISKEKCLHDGLVVRADSNADSITINLGGQTIVGGGHGYGILVEYGGSDGAVIVGSSSGRMAQIVGFRRGVYAPTTRAVSRLEAVSVIANSDDGIRINGKGAILVDINTSKNSGNGIAMRGMGGRIANVHAVDNGNAGVRLAGKGTIVTGVVEGNAKHGIVVGGSKNDVRGVEARNNAGLGVAVHGRGQQLDGVISERNAKGNVGGMRRVRR